MTTLINSKLKVNIKHLGAELTSIKDKNNKEFIWEGDPEHWGKHSPVLFPIVGTLKNNHFIYNNVPYYLSRHGFARDSIFNLIDSSDSQAVFFAMFKRRNKKVFPFNFELQICYILEETKLQIVYKIINKDTIIIPFSIGAHPAFALPNKFEDYSLDFECSEKLISYKLDNDLLSDTTNSIPLNGKQLSLSYSLFKDDALIFKEIQSKNITISENNTPLLRVQFDDFPNLGIWTKSNAPFICIEPWFGYSDTLEATGNLVEKEAVQFVAPNETFNCKFSIEIL